MNKIKVLYIAGWGRSGSTVLGNILGEVQGFFHVGEMRHMWGRLASGRVCGCGKLFAECPFWGPCLQKTFGGVSPEFAQEVINKREATSKTKHFLLNRKKMIANSTEFRAILHKLYAGIKEQAGCDVIVDGSKFPGYGYLLANNADIELHTIHLVRDPRATAYSWYYRQKKTHDKADGSENKMDKHSPLKDSLLWNLRNRLIQNIWQKEGLKYHLVNYETFVREPQKVVRGICEFVGQPDAKLPFTSESEVHLNPNHTVAGNPNRLKTGNVKLKVDNEWETKMNGALKGMVTLLTAPTRHRFGY